MIGENIKIGVTKIPRLIRFVLLVAPNFQRYWSKKINKKRWTSFWRRVQVHTQKNTGVKFLCFAQIFIYLLWILPFLRLIDWSTDRVIWSWKIKPFGTLRYFRHITTSYLLTNKAKLNYTINLYHLFKLISRTRIKIEETIFLINI